MRGRSMQRVWCGTVFQPGSSAVGMQSYRLSAYFTDLEMCTKLMQSNGRLLRIATAHAGEAPKTSILKGRSSTLRISRAEYLRGSPLGIPASLRTQSAGAKNSGALARPDRTSGQDFSESLPTERTDMKIRLVVVWMVFLGALQLSAQDWSSWTTANNRDFQYRWLGGAPSTSGECYLQLRDLKRQPSETTFVTVLIDYQSAQAESARNVITIMDPKDEDQGPRILSPCVSVRDVHVKDIVRCETSGCRVTNWPWL
jgi:hypothetical protein